MAVVEQAEKQGSTEGMTRRYQTMPMAQLRDMARDPGHAEAAGRVLVDRVIEIEAETRLWHDHGNPGFQPFSPTATIGQPPGGSSAAAEPLAIQYERYVETSPERIAVREFIQQARLHPRQLLAVLIRGAKSYPRSTGAMCRGYDDIAQDLSPVAQMLGFGPVACMDDVRQGAGAKPMFANGMAIKDAARAGRAELVLLAQI